MKKFLLSCVFLIIGLQGYSRVFSFKDTYFMAFGYSHSVVHSSNPDNYSFNNISEYWCQIGPLEFTVYYDMTDYGDPVVIIDNITHWNEYDYKSYTHDYRDFQQQGYWGMKLGVCLGKYFSGGIVLDFGADGYTTQGQYTYFNSIKDSITLPQAEGDTIYSSPYSNKGFGGYIKISYQFNLGTYFAISPFVSGQLTTNNNNFLSVGVIIGMKNFLFN